MMRRMRAIIIHFALCDKGGSQWLRWHWDTLSMNWPLFAVLCNRCGKGEPFGQFKRIYFIELGYKDIMGNGAAELMRFGGE